MKKFAILDTGAGFLQWLGDSESIAAAVCKLHAEVGDFITEDQSDTEESLVIYEVSEVQAAQMQDWSDSGSKSGTFPKMEGVTYTVGEVRAMLTH